ncbi:hypothetical protein [Raineyella fluvialis]|uniref:Uncharacterized protein n=1 Tax=Raineyella fluvialis TaxID=2662261 RepID=A0A5Q2FC64_9ACTN|nr:hypothetical protein [Raineyella fluvialis]QGF24379.1 hypothetical protein Rai3103_12715 [Raineyella fluvialis]
MTTDAAPEPLARPLRPEDPPRVGGFWLDARLADEASGVAYAAHEYRDHERSGGREVGEGQDGGPREVVLVLLSRGAAAERVARDRFTGRVDRLHVDLVVARGGHGQDSGRLTSRLRPSAAPVADAEPEAPWVALAAGQLPLAESILADVGLALPSVTPPPAGPDYRLPWADDTTPGRTSQWPLPWPGRHDRAGWVTLFVSWLLMVLLTALAIAIAILLFRHEPPQSPPPPQPQSASASPSPSPSSASATPSPSPSPRSASPSASPTASASGIPERSKL